VNGPRKHSQFSTSVRLQRSEAWETWGRETRGETGRCARRRERNRRGPFGGRIASIEEEWRAASLRQRAENPKVPAETLGQTRKPWDRRDVHWLREAGAQPLRAQNEERLASLNAVIFHQRTMRAG